MGKTKRLLTKACRETKRGNSFKVKEDRFRMERRRTFLKVRAVRPGSGCPEKFWVSYPWKCSRSDWMRLWANLFKERYLCPWQDVETKGPSDSKQFMMLWWINIYEYNTYNIKVIDFLILSIVCKDDGWFCFFFFSLPLHYSLCIRPDYKLRKSCTYLLLSAGLLVI